MTHSPLPRNASIFRAASTCSSLPSLIAVSRVNQAAKQRRSMVPSFPASAMASVTSVDVRSFIRQLRSQWYTPVRFAWKRHLSCILAVLTIACLGCANDEELVGLPPAPIAKSGTLISRDQIDSLFAASWTADDEATRQYSGNSDVDDLDAKSWQYCIQWKVSGFFKDQGFLMRKAAGEPVLHEIDYEADLNDTLRVIDDDHFALKVGAGWVVFRSVRAQHL